MARWRDRSECSMIYHGKDSESVAVHRIDDMIISWSIHHSILYRWDIRCGFSVRYGRSGYHLGVPLSRSWSIRRWWSWRTTSRRDTYSELRYDSREGSETCSIQVLFLIFSMMIDFCHGIRVRSEYLMMRISLRKGKRWSLALLFFS